MKTLARHLLAELYGSSHDALDDLDRVREALRDGVRAIGATPLGGDVPPLRSAGGVGNDRDRRIALVDPHVARVFLRRARHLHLWRLDPRPGFEVIGRVLGAERVRVQEVLRGLAEEVAKEGPIGPEDIIVLARTTEELPLAPDAESAPNEEAIR